MMTKTKIAILATLTTSAFAGGAPRENENLFANTQQGEACSLARERADLNEITARRAYEGAAHQESRDAFGRACTGMESERQRMRGVNNGSENVWRVAARALKCATVVVLVAMIPHWAGVIHKIRSGAMQQSDVIGAGITLLGVSWLAGSIGLTWGMELGRQEGRSERRFRAAEQQWRDASRDA